MDSFPNTNRKKKSDKAKEKFDRNGGHSSKHVRIQEAVASSKRPITKK